MTPSTVAQIRAKMITVLGDDLGDYARPGLPNTKAIWVADRPLPIGYKVIEQAPPLPLINAMECTIYYAADYSNQPLNIKSRRLDETFSCWLSLHDNRQSARCAIGAILANFEVLGDFIHAPASDLNPEQYSFRILNRYQVKEKFR